MLSNWGSLLLYVACFSASSYSLNLYYRNKKRILFLLVAILIPVIIAGMRGIQCGADSAVYIGNASHPTTDTLLEIISKQGIFESLYIESNKLATIFNTPRAPLIFWALVTIAIIVWWILHSTKHVGIVYFMYLFMFFTTSINVSRQYAALSVIMLSSKFIIDRKWIKYYICIVFACMIHTSALFMIPVYFLWTKKQNIIDKKLCVIIIIGLIVLVSQLQSFLDNLSGYDTGVDSINRYLSYNDEAGSKNRDFFLEIFTTIVILLHIKKLTKIKKENQLYMLLLCIGLCLTATGFVSPFVKRVAVYFTIYKIALIPQLIEIYEGRERFIVKILIVAFVMTQFILVYFVLGQAMVIPYSWYIPKYYWTNL